MWKLLLIVFKYKTAPEWRFFFRAGRSCFLLIIQKTFCHKKQSNFPVRTQCHEETVSLLFGGRKLQSSQPQLPSHAGGFRGARFSSLPTTPAWEAKDAKPQHDFARSMFFNSAEINVNKIDATWINAHFVNLRGNVNYASRPDLLC